jgi:hypothetical protein
MVVASTCFLKTENSRKAPPGPSGRGASSKTSQVSGLAWLLHQKNRGPDKISGGCKNNVLYHVLYNMNIDIYILYWYIIDIMAPMIMYIYIIQYLYIYTLFSTALHYSSVRKCDVLSEFSLENPWIERSPPQNLESSSRLSKLTEMAQPIKSTGVFRP